MNVGYNILNAFPVSHDLVSRLHDTSVRIQEIAHYVRNVAEELARDEISLEVLTERILHEVGLALDNADACVHPSRHHIAYFDNEMVGRPLQTRELISFVCDVRVR